MTDAQGWTLLALVGVTLGVIGGLIVNQFHLLLVALQNPLRLTSTRSIKEAPAPSTDHRYPHTG